MSKHPKSPAINLLALLFPSQDQYDQIEKHTQSGIDLLELYIKFVKERTEIEQGYAKQLRCLFLPLCLSVAVPGVMNVQSRQPRFLTAGI